MTNKKIYEDDIDEKNPGREKERTPKPNKQTDNRTEKLRRIREDNSFISLFYFIWELS